MSTNGHISPCERHLMAADERARARREDKIREQARGDAAAEHAEKLVVALAEHEQVVMVRERTRERRRLDALVQLPVEYGDFEGCVI